MSEPKTVNLRFLKQFLKNAGLPAGDYQGGQVPESLLAEYYSLTAATKAFSYQNHYLVEHLNQFGKFEKRTASLTYLKQQAFLNQRPFTHIGHAPREYTSVFMFRVDLDSLYPGSIEVFLKTAAQYQIPLTFFVHVQAALPCLTDIERIARAGHEIALHCFRHQVYPDFSDIYRDVEKGLRVLKGLGIDVSGYAAPFGIWSPELNRALESQGFLYSSEFSAGYDDIPLFLPLSGKGWSKVLQILVHPISLESLQDGAVPAEQIPAYFQATLKYLKGLQIPIVLYGHPNPDPVLLEKVLAAIFSEVTADVRLYKSTMNQFARFWQQRLAANFQIASPNDCLVIKTEKDQPNLFLRIERSDGQAVRVAFKTEAYPLSALPWSCEDPPLSPVLIEAQDWVARFYMTRWKLRRQYYFLRKRLDRFIKG